MPKRPAQGHTNWRDQFVEQMRVLQDARGMSDAALAHRISEHYPMSPSAVWKLKHGRPVRGLMLDEAMAIVYAFGFSAMDQFLSTYTTAARAQERIAAAREAIIIYRQELPVRDVLGAIREASDGLELATGNGQKLKDAEIANLRAGAARVQQEADDMLEAVEGATARIAAYLADLQTSIESNMSGGAE